MITGANLLREDKSAAPEPTSPQLEAAFPDADNFIERHHPFRHWLARRKSGEVAGAVFITTDLPPDIKGYVGPVPVLVGMDANGVIKRLVVLENKETPYYMKRVLRSGFLEKFRDKSVTEKLADIDAVTGATITSEAVAGDVETASRLAAKQLFDIKVPESKEVGGKEVEAAALGFVLLVALAARIRNRDRALKWASWALAIGVTGAYLAMPLSFSHITRVLSLSFPSLYNLPLLVLLTWAAATTVIWGPVFCGYACPYGALQEIIWRIFPGAKWSISPRSGGIIRSFRWILLFVLVALVFPIGINEAAGFEPYPYFFERIHGLIFEPEEGFATDALTVSIWAYALFVLLVSGRFKRFWCRVFCPTGACLSLLSLRRRIRASGDEEAPGTSGEEFF